MRKFLGLLLSGLLIVGILTGCACTAIEVDVGPLSIQDSEIVTGESFIVEANIKNIGESDGNFTASIRLDDKVVGKKKVWIAAGATEMVQFDCIAETPGTHTLKLEDSSTTFTALKPADFEVTLLSVPAEAYTRKATVIEANVTNNGEAEGIYNGRLIVDGTEKASSNTPIAAGTTETITLTITINTPGSYTIRLDNATATLTVFLAFPDANLEAVIRKSINKLEGHIYISDLESLTTLVAQESEISDLTDIEYCVNLQELQIGQNNISDLSPLASLTNLQALGLESNNISNLSPLAGLTNLKHLWLSENNISDISILAGLNNLDDLWLHDTNISDISPLTNNSGLSVGDFVDLRYNPLSTESINVYIPQLEARGVDITY